VSGPVPLDDVLKMARTAGTVLAERSYRRLMRRVRQASADWDMSEPARTACLAAHSMAFKRTLGLNRRRRR
jgi:hypothetical protein